MHKASPVISTSPLFRAINFLYSTVYEMGDMRLFSELAHNLKLLNFTNHFIRERENPPSVLQNKHEVAT